LEAGLCESDTSDRESPHLPVRRSSPVRPPGLGRWGRGSHRRECQFRLKECVTLCTGASVLNRKATRRRGRDGAFLERSSTDPRPKRRRTRGEVPTHQSTSSAQKNEERHLSVSHPSSILTADRIDPSPIAAPRPCACVSAEAQGIQTNPVEDPHANRGRAPDTLPRLPVSPCCFAFLTGVFRASSIGMHLASVTARPRPSTTFPSPSLPFITPSLRCRVQRIVARHAHSWQTQLRERDDHGNATAYVA
jgi:hypothetical protein